MRPAQKPSPAAPVRVALKHHFLVRLAHWANVPILLGLMLSGLSIHWAAPVYHLAPDPQTGETDTLARVGAAVARHLPFVSAPAAGWVYDHFALGRWQLAPALRLHWFFAYLFMANGALYLVGLLAGGGFRALLPRWRDVRDAGLMVRYYLGIVPMRLLRRAWTHPVVRGKYNALQRGAYASMALAGAISIASGWAMHKPSQLGWLERLFGSYDGARQWHFWMLWLFAAFVVPHVVLVLVDGWDTLRSMVTGWSRRLDHEQDQAR